MLHPDYENLRKQTYINLATCHNGIPWVAACIFWMDKGDLLIVSHLGSQHVKDMIANPQVAFNTYDSSIPQGQGNGKGLQGSGWATVLTKEEDIIKAMKSAHQQRFRNEEEEKVVAAKDIWKKVGRVIVRIKIDRLYVNRVREDRVDCREEIPIPSSGIGVLQEPFHSNGKLQPITSKL